MTAEKRPLKLGPPRRRPTPRKLRWPPLDEEEILAWADAHHERTGEWPAADSGVVVGGYGEKWSTISQALRVGVRSLPGGSSLARLLAKHRGYRNRKGLAPYTEERILGWCDSYFARHGEWPHCNSGPIEDAPGETWMAVSMALMHNIRGIIRHTSLAQLLEERRGVPNPQNRPHMTLEQILSWADAYHALIGEWPTLNAEPIPDMGNETWVSVNRALRNNLRGLHVSCSSLARLLETHRGHVNRLNQPKLTIEQILAWADVYYNRTGKWPKSHSGPVEEATDMTWAQVHWNLSQGNRGLPGGSSLARLLAEQRGVRHHLSLPALNQESILHWADSYYAHRRRWPNINSGPVEEAPEETWNNLDNALRQGARGLPGGSSLARLLADRRGHRNPTRLPDLTLEQILSWADAHFERSGRWPVEDSGGIAEAPGETWAGISTALRLGKRGLAGNFSLARLLAEARGRKFYQRGGILSRGQILLWADEYHARTGHWPTTNSEEVAGEHGLTWNAVNTALGHGLRGLEPGDSLARLLAKERSKRNRAALPPLSEDTILEWAQAHYRRAGRWPTQKSGLVAEAPGETWGGIDQTLESGKRGLPGGISLPILLDRIRKSPVT